MADTNLLAQLLLGGDAVDAARAVYARDHEWSAPVLWRSEFANVLAGFLRRGELSVTDAEEFHAHAEELLRGREYFVPAARVLKLAAESSCSAYDCEFVALAQILDARLVTSDQEVLRAFPEVALAPDAFASA